MVRLQDHNAKRATKGYWNETTGRPSDNNPECTERQAVFRERPREVEIVSADGGPPLMEPGDCPVLSSSNFGVWTLSSPWPMT